MQAILTKYIPATNFKPSRIKASCERGQIIVSYGNAGSNEEEHIAAADALVKKFVEEDKKKYGTEFNPWARLRVYGQLKSGEYVHVFASHENQTTI